MPLIKGKSKKAFEHNIKAEMHAGKPQAQSLAIAYDVKRRASKKKMADGGKVDNSAKDEKRVSIDSLTPEEMAMIHEYRAGRESEINFHDEKRPSIDSAKDKREMAMLAHGGEIDARDEHMTTVDDARDEREMEMLDEHPIFHKEEKRAGSEMTDIDHAEDDRDEDMIKHKSIAAAIMHRKKMADGGMVDLSRNADEDSNYEDDLSFGALKKENYSESEGLDELDSPMDSGMHGDEREKDAEDEHDMISSIRGKMKSKKRI